MTNIITNGDCIEVMAGMPSGSADFILTDPPYLVNYRDRTGRRVANDDNTGWLHPAFAQMHRVLKNNAFAVSFYSWNRIDRFMRAWRQAGFTPAGHIVFVKDYASSTRYMQYRHEQAYLLAKGRPALPVVEVPTQLVKLKGTGKQKVADATPYRLTVFVAEESPASKGGTLLSSIYFSSWQISWCQKSIRK